MWFLVDGVRYGEKFGIVGGWYFEIYWLLLLGIVYGLLLLIFYCFCYVVWNWVDLICY